MEARDVPRLQMLHRGGGRRVGARDDVPMRRLHQGRPTGERVRRSPVVGHDLRDADEGMAGREAHVEVPVLDHRQRLVETARLGEGRFSDGDGGEGVDEVVRQ